MRSLLNQDTQIRNSRAYSDALAAGSTLESAAVSSEDDFNALRSQVNRVLKGDGTLNWYDDVPTVNSKKRGLYDLNLDLDDLEIKPFLFRTQILTNITVPAAVKATGTLTLTGNAGNGEIVTIDTKTYTFQTVLTNVDGNVLIGGSASDSLDNLIAAITLGAGSGTLYAAATTLHPTVTAVAGAGDTMDATAKLNGTLANTYATTTDLANGSWGSATLTGGTGDMVVLSQASSETPSQVAAVTGTAFGAVVKVLSGDVGGWSAAEVTGSSPVSPFNLCIVRNAATDDPILDVATGKTIYALFQAESGVVDGDAFNDTTKQCQLSFVIEQDAPTHDLVHFDPVDIAGLDINYGYVRRLNFDAIPEYAFLTGAFVDQSASVDVTRQNAYNNQGSTAVDVLTNSILDLEGAGLYWKIRDDLQADLFTITEGSAGGTTTLQLGADVDVLDVNAIATDFANDIKIDTAGTEIDIGVNAGVIETTSTNDLRILGAGELYLDDGNQTGSTWAQTNGIKLSDTTAEWSAFEVLYGEVSLLNAINQAAIKENRNKTKAYVTAANIPAGTNVTGAGGTPNISAQLGAYTTATFPSDVDVFVNGELQVGAAGATDDTYPGTTDSNGDLKFTFLLHINDVIQTIVYGV